MAPGPAGRCRAAGGAGRVGAGPDGRRDPAGAGHVDARPARQERGRGRCRPAAVRLVRLPPGWLGDHRVERVHRARQLRGHRSGLGGCRHRPGPVPAGGAAAAAAAGDGAGGEIPAAGHRLAGAGAAAPAGAFPSGGSARVVLVGGMVAWLLARRSRDRRAAGAAWTVVALAAFMEGYSRLYLGRHWIADVIGGWVFGALLLAVLLAAATLLPLPSGQRLGSACRGWASQERPEARDRW